jgi:hypothetical protein
VSDVAPHRQTDPAERCRVTARLVTQPCPALLRSVRPEALTFALGPRAPGCTF